MTQVHAVTLLNQKLSLRSEHSEAYVQEVTTFVDDKIREVMEKLHNVSSLNAALMACLNIADELFKNREKEGHAKEKVVKIIESIEKHLKSE